MMFTHQSQANSQSALFQQVTGLSHKSSKDFSLTYGKLFRPQASQMIAADEGEREGLVYAVNRIKEHRCIPVKGFSVFLFCNQGIKKASLQARKLCITR
jgi:hypothetical protein